MKKSQIIIIITVIFLASCGGNSDRANDNNASGQKDEVVNIEKDAPPSEEVVTDAMFPAAPSALSVLANPLNIDLRSIAYFWIKTLKEFDYTGFDVTEKPQDYPAYFIAYALFYSDNQQISKSGMKDYDDCVKNGSSPEEAVKCFLRSFKEKLMYRIYSSKELQEEAYMWLLPEWQEALAGMQNERKKIISDIINHCISYTKNYNYSKELNFYNQCQGDKEYLFTTTARIVNGVPDYDNGIVNPYRKAEAWIFRRVHMKHMTAAEINSWLKRIKKDVKL